MSPDPYIRGQLIAACILILACVAMNSWLAALIGSAVMLLSALGLERRYRHDLHAAEGVMPEKRLPLDRMVISDGRVALAVLLLAIVVRIIVTSPLLPGLYPYRPALVALAAAGAAIYGSSLVDWFVILPRISGQLGPRPCRDAEATFALLPRTWKETTRWWYIHRVAATIIFRAALAVALGNIIGHVADLGLAGKGLIAAVSGLFSVYISDLRWAAPEAVDVQRNVGETVRVGRIRPPRFRLPWQTSALPDLKGRFYLVDVDIAAIQLIGLRRYEESAEHCDAAGEERREPETVDFARHPDQLPLRHLSALRLANHPTEVCRGCCGRINWYCIENPNCYAHK